MHLVVNLIYMFNSFIVIFLLIQSQKNQKKLQRNMEIILLDLHFRNMIRVWDFEQTKENYEDEKDFFYQVVGQLLAVYCNFIYNCVFIKQTLRQRIYTPVLTVSIVISSQVGIYGSGSIISEFSKLGLIAIFLAFIIAQN